jgi:hypothetical protein
MAASEVLGFQVPVRRFRTLIFRPKTATQDPERGTGEPWNLGLAVVC